MDLLLGALLVLGPLGVLAFGACSAVFAVSWTRGVARRVAVGLTVTAVLAVGTVWWSWGVGFEAAEAYREVPGWVDPLMIGSGLTALAAMIVLIGIAVAAQRRRSSTVRATAPSV